MIGFRKFLKLGITVNKKWDYVVKPGCLVTLEKGYCEPISWFSPKITKEILISKGKYLYLLDNDGDISRILRKDLED